MSHKIGFINFNKDGEMTSRIFRHRHQRHDNMEKLHDMPSFSETVKKTRQGKRKYAPDDIKYGFTRTCLSEDKHGYNLYWTFKNHLKLFFLC